MKNDDIGVPGSAIYARQSSEELQTDRADRMKRSEFMTLLRRPRLSRPQIRWHGDRIPSAEELDKMHHCAHENCFIANAVKTDVTVAKP
jgi:organic hydroperoxide reductase OsmC/OhrA